MSADRCGRGAGRRAVGCRGAWRVHAEYALGVGGSGRSGGLSRVLAVLGFLGWCRWAGQMCGWVLAGANTSGWVQADGRCRRVQVGGGYRAIKKKEKMERKRENSGPDHLHHCIA